MTATTTALLVLLALPAIAIAMIWLGMLVDTIITKSDVWLATGHDRLFCFLLVIGLGPVGAVLYGIFIRPELTRAELEVAVERPKKANQWAA